MNKKVNLKDKFQLFDDYWTPKIVGELNGQYVKLAKFKGEMVWHSHENEDEFFNLDEIEWLPSESEYKQDETWSKSRIYEITWIPVTEITWWVDKDTLTLRTFYYGTGKKYVFKVFTEAQNQLWIFFQIIFVRYLCM